MADKEDLVLINFKYIYESFLAETIPISYKHKYYALSS